ncbi:MAG: hypothetical protein ACR2QO_03025 [Acidimicrobiales bacterium]
MEKITRVARSALQRFAQLPPWAVLAQLFLGIGWLRAGIAHGFSGTWWSGDELLRFVAERRPQALPVYGFFLDNIVVAIPTGIAVVVLLAELGIGISLLANVRRLEALAVGCFLNLHFIAAGQVNPSIFYLIISLSLGGRLLESQLSTERVGRLAQVASIVAAVVVVVLVPAVDTMAPAGVIEDPASVLIFLALLVVGALWASYARRIGATGTFGTSGVSCGRWLTTEEVVDEVEQRTGYAFSAELHATVARKVGVRPPADDAERTTKRDFAIYVAEADRYLYSQPWIDALVAGLSTAESFEKLVDQPPRACGSAAPTDIEVATPPAAPRIDVSAEEAERAEKAELAELVEKAVGRATIDLAGSETELELVSLDLRSVDRESEQQGFEIIVRP